MGEYNRFQSADGASTLYYTRPHSRVRRLPVIVFHGQVGGTGDPSLTMWDGDQGVYYRALARATNLVFIAHNMAFNVGAGSNPVNSWMNKASLLKAFSWFGAGNFLDTIGCRYDKAWFEAGSAGAQAVGIFGQNYPSLVAGATIKAASMELERDRVVGDGQSKLDINNAYLRPTSEVGQVDVDGTATGHPTTIDPNTGITIPAWYFGTSIKGETGTPRAGEIVTCCHPLNMNIWRDSIVGAGAKVDFYESLGDTTAGPNTGSFIPNPQGTGWLKGSGRIWQTYIGATRHTVSATAEHGELVKYLPVQEIADTILAAA